MKITHSRLRQVIREEVQRGLLSEGLKNVISLAKSWAPVADIGFSAKGVGDRLLAAEGVGSWLRGEMGAAAENAYEEALKTGAIKTYGALTAAEMTGIVFALGIPALALWSASRGTAPEGIIRNQHSFMNSGNRRRGRPERPLTMSDVADPFSPEFARSYTVKRGAEGALVALVRDRGLARELLEDGVIGGDIMEWSDGWRRKIAEARRVYRRQKYLSTQGDRG